MATGRYIFKAGERFEHYQVVRKLGEGGMGAVYQVRHPALDATFALKVLFPDVAVRNQEFVDRFVREARLSSRLRHPNLIAVHDAGKDIQQGMYYLVMDFVGGGSVRDRLKKQGRMDSEDAFAVILQVLSALTEARRNGMVHRDIKPDNIMYTESGVVKLADLGIAKSTSECDATLTMDSTVFGTPAYMSPEQAHDAKDVDCRADIYSLGIVFFEMLTGRTPYRGSSMAIIAEIVKPTEIPDIRTVNMNIPDKIAHIIRKMCAKNREERYASPEEVIADMEKMLDGLSATEYFAHIAQKENRNDTTGRQTGDSSTIISSRETWENDWLRAKKRKFFLKIAAGVLAVAFLGYGIFALIHNAALKRAEEEKQRLALVREDFQQKVANEKSELENQLKQMQKQQTAKSDLQDATLDWKQIEKDKNSGIQFSENGKFLIKFPKDDPRTEYTIPNGVVSIAGYAFSECNNLNKIVMPDSVVTIGTAVFQKCKNLKSVKLSKNLTNTGDSSFFGCTSLESIEIPDSVVEIGDATFLQCTKLKSVKFSRNLTEIGVRAFAECVFLKSIDIPDSVTVIGAAAFSDGGLKNIKLSRNLIQIGRACFAGCYFLESIEIPDSVERMDGAFYHCIKLKSIKLSQKLTRVDGFSDCTSLELIEIPDSVTEIGAQAFQNCKKLKSVKLSQNLRRIYLGTFRGCYSLESIDIPDNVTLIDECAFTDCKNLKSVKLSKNLTKIDERAFEGNYSLESIEIPDSVTEIKSRAFYNCDNLTTVKIAKNVKGRGYAFGGTPYGDKTVPTNTLQYSVLDWEQIEKDKKSGIQFSEDGKTLIKFSVNDLRTEYTVPNGVTMIADRAFNRCFSLKSIKIPDSVTVIEEGAFFYCRNLKNVILPQRLTRIERGVFANCSSLESIEIPKRVKDIEYNAFAGCIKLKTVNIPKYVHVAKDAFSGTPYGRNQR